MQKEVEEKLNKDCEMKDNQIKLLYEELQKLRDEKKMLFNSMHQKEIIHGSKRPGRVPTPTR
jgi:hypothetical protein